MDPKSAARQIQQMARFIMQEAEEKSAEIQSKAEEEYNIEKQRMVEEAKGKLRKEYERKEKNLYAQQRIGASLEQNSLRLQILQSQDLCLKGIKEHAYAGLSKSISDGKQYQSLLKALILQGLLKLKNEERLIVLCRKVDVAAAKTAAKDASMEHKKRYNVTIDLVVDEQQFLPDRTDDGYACAGGVELYTSDRRICVKNSLNARLEICYQELLPKFKEILWSGMTTKIGS